MKILRYLIQKEFIQILRNKALLPMMTILPIVQLILLSTAASNEVKNVDIVIVDLDQTESSRLLKRKIIANNRFSLIANPFSTKEANQFLQANKADIALVIPNDFEKDFLRREKPSLQIIANAINGQQATVGSGYLSNIIYSFNENLIQEYIYLQALNKKQKENPIQIVPRNWYNEELKYTHFMAPGILAELTALLTIVLSAMNIVREREIGTIEQINVTPIKKWQFILGKLIPFLCVGIVLLVVGILTSKIVFDIPIVGNVGLLFGYAIINLIAVLGLGLLISNFANTQQQAIFVAFFFILIFILMCGLFTPIDSMPKWAQYFTIPNPLAQFVSVSRKILMKGSTIWDIRFEIFYTIILAIVFNSLAIWSYKKQE
ncbi:ABC transporter permease [Aureivirga marina]|uniref:ABC transporter permease n=1 Tax=Aureivirga marina TaxID=1182451 RepID=UPI0018CAF905|nr:ABC transporter permease [Aureivirga marina]